MDNNTYPGKLFLMSVSFMNYKPYHDHNYHHLIVAINQASIMECKTQEPQEINILVLLSVCGNHSNSICEWKVYLPCIPRRDFSTKSLSLLRGLSMKIKTDKTE